jgi:hypothetical protein
MTPVLAYSEIRFFILDHSEIPHVMTVTPKCLLSLLRQDHQSFRKAPQPSKQKILTYVYSVDRRQNDTSYTHYFQ